MDLRPGENASIALAEELGAAHLLIDDRDAWALASKRGLSVIGTLTILDEAANRDLIDLPRTVATLRTTNCFMSEHLLEELLARQRERERARRSRGGS